MSAVPRGGRPAAGLRCFFFPLCQNILTRRAGPGARSHRRLRAGNGSVPPGAGPRSGGTMGGRGPGQVTAARGAEGGGGRARTRSPAAGGGEARGQAPPRRQRAAMRRGPAERRRSRESSVSGLRLSRDPARRRLPQPGHIPTGGAGRPAPASGAEQRGGRRARERGAAGGRAALSRSAAGRARGRAAASLRPSSRPSPAAGATANGRRRRGPQVGAVPPRAGPRPPL